MSLGNRFRRMAAWIVDWLVSNLPAMLFAMLILTFRDSINLLILLLVFPIFILCLALFVLRDLIFKGRSIGKRLLGLYIYTRTGFSAPKKEHLWVRNIFFFIYFFDGVVLLATGKTIGDRVTETMVITQKELRKLQASSDALPRSRPLLSALKIVAILGVFFVCFIASLLLILNALKATEEHQTAYQYFVSSETFKATGADPDDIFMNSYRKYTPSKHVNQGTTAEISFRVNGRYYTVVCHRTDGKWLVCDECTYFD